MNLYHEFLNNKQQSFNQIENYLIHNINPICIKLDFEEIIEKV